MEKEKKYHPVLRMPHPIGLGGTPSVVWWKCVEAFLDAELKDAYEKGRLAGREEIKCEIQDVLAHEGSNIK